MQYEKTTNTVEALELPLIKISRCKTFHVLQDKPLYNSKFLHVEKFHAPGYAPVRDNTGAYHINVAGEAIYNKRFIQSHGFYCDLAAIEDAIGCYHINFKGDKIYKRSYDWIGNYQENICVVRESNKFYHIDLEGNKIYDALYDYVGDFKDNIAVVYLGGKATHINSTGALIHNNWYKQLGVFHKGFAIAEDRQGWFHIDMNGNPIYNQRYKEIEPFYNGLAKVEKYDGTLEQIDIHGNTRIIIFEPSIVNKIHKISGELAGFWNTYLIGAAIELDLLKLLPSTLELLSTQLEMQSLELQRLLRALWEIELLAYNSESKVWNLTSKGVLLQSTPFLRQAATMWPRVASQINWLNIGTLLSKPAKSSFLSFKEQETSENIKAQFYEALIGYTTLDAKKFREQISLDNATKILLLGVHSLAIIDMLKTECSNSLDSNELTIGYHNDPEIPSILFTKYGVNNVEFKQYINKYDIAICCRFLQNYDDKKLLFYLQLIKQQKIPRILIIETLLTNLSPIGGAVDINIMVETGGRLRTLKDWEAIITEIDYNIFNVSYLTDYLSIIDIRRKD